MCCICNGTCMHVGPHSYCGAHWPAWPPTPAPYRPPTCEHCYCEPVPPDHRKCCNCGNKQRRATNSPHLSTSGSQTPMATLPPEPVEDDG